VSQPLQLCNQYDGQVLEIRLNAPPANILTSQMMTELERAIRDAHGIKKLKAIVLSGAGNHFSYGASVEEHLPEKVAAMLPGFHHLIECMLSSEILLVARVWGFCLGGAVEVDMACTFVFADEGAKFGVPEITLGVFPPVACALLPLYGPSLASRLIVTGERVGARDLGALVTCVSSALDKDLQEFLQSQILSKSASSLRFANSSANAHKLRVFREHIGELEKRYLHELMKSADACEGILAFVEKRPVRWSDA
jgi:cyclohexa-1,5-dienecarbonyl-CoA hydratase